MVSGSWRNSKGLVWVWNALCKSHGDYINVMTGYVKDYINFCVESIIPSCTVRSFPDNPQWPEKLPNRKKKSFKEGPLIIFQCFRWYIEVYASTTTWIIDYLTNSLWKLKGFCVWEGGQQQRSTTGDCTHGFSSLCTLQTSSTIQSPVISRSTLMPL